MIGDQFTSVFYTGINCLFQGFFPPIFPQQFFILLPDLECMELFLSHIYTITGTTNFETNSSVAMQKSTDAVVVDGRRGL
jgi:hypothetical protein